MVVKFSPLQQGNLINLGLEIYWKASKARNTIGQVDAEYDGFHAFYWERLSHHRLGTEDEDHDGGSLGYLGSLHQCDHTGVGLDIK